jgi:hypothetical protein
VLARTNASRGDADFIEYLYPSPMQNSMNAFSAIPTWQGSVTIKSLSSASGNAKSYWIFISFADVGICECILRMNLTAKIATKRLFQRARVRKVIEYLYPSPMHGFVNAFSAF